MKTAVVTGANGAIGKAIAHQLALNQYEVILVCRNEGKAQKAVQEIQKQTGNPNILYHLVDLSRASSIREFANQWKNSISILVNNAAITPRPRQETPEGLELQFATNVLGYLWMIQALHSHLKAAAPSCVVNVASYWAGGLDIKDLQFQRRRYDNDTAYRQSKQANRMLTVALADQYRSDSIFVNACHPGDVNSKLSNDLGFGGHQTPEEGAKTPVWLTSHCLQHNLTGKYFEHQREVQCEFSKNRKEVDSLYQTCLSFNLYS